MRRRELFLICMVSLVSVGIVLLLYIGRFKDQRFNHASFTRVLSNQNPFASDTIHLRYNSYYLAGTANGRLYLGNSTAPFHVLRLNVSTGDTCHLKISVLPPVKMDFNSLTLKVDSPFFYLIDGTIPTIFKGEIQSMNIIESLSDSVYFADLEPLDSETFIIKSLSAESRELVLGKIDRRNSNVQLRPGLLETQIDGVFCTDGDLHYDRKSKLIVYNYRYRNQYLVIDSNLNLVKRFNTIDSISKAKIKVGNISSANATTMTAPRFIVNKKAVVFNRQLYINSNIMGKNETVETFNESSVIDVYDFTRGQYLCSFSIPNFNGSGIRHLLISLGKLVVLYEFEIVLFELGHNSSRYFTCKNQDYDRGL